MLLTIPRLIDYSIIHKYFLRAFLLDGIEIILQKIVSKFFTDNLERTIEFSTFSKLQLRHP